MATKLGCLILAGQHGNALHGAALTSSSASAVASLASLEALRDGRNNQVFRFASPAASSEWIRADVRGLTNGGFETWAGGVTEGWTLYTTGTGVAAREATVVREGASALRLAKGTASDTALAVQRASVPSGARRRLRWSLRGNASASIGLLVSNTRTGRSLAPDGTWSEAVNVALVGGGSAWADGQLDFTVEPYSVTGADLCELVLRVYAGSGTGHVYADAIELLPVCDFVALSGHNLDPGTNVELLGLDVVAGVETESLVARVETWQPACYRRFAATAYPAWRLRFTAPVTGRNSDGAPWLAEWILGAPYEGRVIRQGMKAHEQERQVEQTTPAGHRTVRNRTVRAARSLELGWQLLGPAQLAQLKGEIFGRGRGGQHPLCVVPWLDLEQRASTPPEGQRTVLVATVDPELQWTWPGPREFGLSVTLDEQAFPAVDELVE